ncbi:MAG: pectin acetylesterase-family hydrolase [Myxococcota bacterium]
MSWHGSTLLVCLGLALLGCGDDTPVTGDGGSGSGSSGGDPTPGATGSPSAPETSGAASTGEGSETGTSGGEDSLDESGTGSEPPSGNPLPEGPVGEWTWVDVEGSMCRDGSMAGLSVRYGTSPNVVIYLSGGNACFNFTSCSITGSDVSNQPNGGNVGVLNRDDPANPVADWTHIYLPYCTGDVFAGSNPDSEHPIVPGGPQQFVGYDNVTLFLERIVPTFPDVEKVLLTGSSAGGFGAAYNFDQTAQAFGPDVDMILIDDAGPPMADEYLRPCLQQHWRDVWGLDETLPADCDECFGPDGGGISNYVTYLDQKYPDATLGLLTSLQDWYIRLFWGYGNNDCSTLNAAIPPSYSGAQYQLGVEDLRDNWAIGDQWGTFFVAGDEHTFLDKPIYFTQTVGDMLVVEWVAAMVDGEPSHHAP